MEECTSKPTSELLKVACVRFLDHKSKDYYINVNNIKHKKNDVNPIMPKNETDFNSKHLYYAYWCECQDSTSYETCRDEKNICDYYKAYIVKLGESKEKVENNTNLFGQVRSSSRIIFPKRSFDDESSQSTDENDEHESQNKKQKLLQKRVRTENSKVILEKYKQNTFLNNRKPMSLDDEEDCTLKNKFRQEQEKNKELLKLNLTLQRILHYCFEELSTDTGGANRRLFFPFNMLNPNDVPHNSGEVSRYSRDSQISRDASQNILDYVPNNDRENSPCIREITANILDDVPKNNREVSRLSGDSPTFDASQKILDDIPNSDREYSPRFRDSPSIDDAPKNNREVSRLFGDSQTSCDNSQNILDDIPNNNKENSSHSRDSPFIDERNNSREGSRRSTDSQTSRDVPRNISDGIPNNNKEVSRRSRDSQSSRDASDNTIDPSNNNEEDLNSLDGTDDDGPKGYEKLYYYKRKLYRLYKSKGALRTEDNQPAEAHERYVSVENNSKIYLGQNFTIGKKTWELLQKKKKEAFFRELAVILWRKYQLINRCLDLQKTSKKLPNRSPMKLLTPEKLNLFLVLAEDYIKEKPAYAHLTDDQREQIIRQSTSSLTNIIRDFRRDENLQNRNEK